MSIDRHGAGWRVRWRATDAKTGETRARSKSFRKRADAVAFERRLNIHGRAPQTGLTVDEWMERWLEHHDGAAQTVDGYRHKLRPYRNRIGRLRLDALRPLDVEDAVRSIAREPGANGRIPSASTVAHGLRILRTCLKAAQARELTNTNAAAAIKAPKVDRPAVRPPSAAEMAAMLEAAAQRDEELHALLYLLAVTGLRLGEALALTKTTVDLEALVVRVEATVEKPEGEPPRIKAGAKTASSRREVSIDAAAAQLLRAQIERVAAHLLATGLPRTGLVFANPATGGPRSPGSVSARLRKIRDAAGVRPAVQPAHGARHFAGTMLYAATKDAKLVQSRLGHSAIATTMDIYVKGSEEADRAAADILSRVLDGR